MEYCLSMSRINNILPHLYKISGIHFYLSGNVGFYSTSDLRISKALLVTHIQSHRNTPWNCYWTSCIKLLYGKTILDNIKRIILC